MIEEDEFFPRAEHPFTEAPPEVGTLLINEPNLTHLEEKLDYIHQRAKYYGEYSFTKLDFIEMVEDLQTAAKAIRRTAR